MNVLQEKVKELNSDIYSQLRHIKDTLLKISGDHTTLLDKLKILFKEQGLAIASVVSAVGLLISTIVLSVTGGSAGGAVEGSAAAGGKKRFVQKQLERLGNFLKYLAGKAGAALPAVIGTVVSFLLRVVSTIVTYAAKHLYMEAAAAVGFVVLYVK